jgi:hypothetical protein
MLIHCFVGVDIGVQAYSTDIQLHQLCWCILPPYGTSGSMVLCIHVLFQSIFTTIFLIYI